MMTTTSYWLLQFRHCGNWHKEKDKVAHKSWRINRERTGRAGEIGGKHIMATTEVETAQESQFLIQDSGDTACTRNFLQLKLLFTFANISPETGDCTCTASVCRHITESGRWLWGFLLDTVAWGTVNTIWEQSQHSTTLTSFLLKTEILSSSDGKVFVFPAHPYPVLDRLILLYLVMQRH